MNILNVVDWSMDFVPVVGQAHGRKRSPVGGQSPTA